MTPEERAAAIVRGPVYLLRDDELEAAIADAIRAAVAEERATTRALIEAAAVANNYVYIKLCDAVNGETDEGPMPGRDGWSWTAGVLAMRDHFLAAIPS